MTITTKFDVGDWVLFSETDDVYKITEVGEVKGKTVYTAYDGYNGCNIWMYEDQLTKMVPEE